MTTFAAEPAVIQDSAETMADLLRRLGDISPARIRMRPAPGTATERDVVRIHGTEKRLFELVDGVLVEKGMGYRESVIALAIVRALDAWSRQGDRGVISGESGMMSLFPGLVRIPDVAFAYWERFPGKRIPEDPAPNLVPDLAVEVLSDSNTKREMSRKRDEYFKAGVRLVWIVDPKSQTIAAYTGAEQFTVLNRQQTLDGGDVLPGFVVAIDQLFAAIAG